MNLMHSCLLSACALLIAAPLAGAALANPVADTANPQATTPAPQPDASATAEATAASPADSAAEGAAKDERICRYVKLETASRRKTKLCRTTEEWRELNNPR